MGLGWCWTVDGSGGGICRALILLGFLASLAHDTNTRTNEFEGYRGG